MDIKIIAAMTPDRVIGKDNDIPWQIPEEQKHFKEETVGSPVIMGRTTFDSIINKINRPLPDRHNIVLSTSKAGLNYSDVSFVKDVGKALRVASQKDDEVYVAGGESVYEQLIDEADEMILSFVDRDVEGDSYFPPFNHSNWTFHEMPELNEGFHVVHYKRNEE